ncbi:MAG: hypothetical protein JWQ78_726 [Sediminibacterium sp.]|nr:hypothetical protein [Sediminibacterium sp.]
MNKLYNLFPALLVSALALSSCGGKNFARNELYCTATPAGDTVLLEYNKPIKIFSTCTKSLESTLTTINDSRCPTDVVCVWAGKVDVIVSINNEFSVLLETGMPKDTIYNAAHYRFTLIDVSPYPKADPPTRVTEQKAAVIITRQQ